MDGVFTLPSEWFINLASGLYRFAYIIYFYVFKYPLYGYTDITNTFYDPFKAVNVTLFTPGANSKVYKLIMEALGLDIGNYTFFDLLTSGLVIFLLSLVFIRFVLPNIFGLFDN